MRPAAPVASAGEISVPAEIGAFARETLAPAAMAFLGGIYADYKAGKDIGIETKADDTPASAADRETESLLRGLIRRDFPDHGIIGEEFPAENINADYVWILDPLDGTREFLAGKDGCFSTLIALSRGGLPVYGLAADPVTGRVWASGGPESGFDKEKPCRAPSAAGAPLREAVIACTNPDAMLKSAGGRAAALERVLAGAARVTPFLNAAGFMAARDGRADACVECGLALHDIAALIPILRGAGVTMTDFAGRDYASRVFDLPSAMGQKFDMIVARDTDLVAELLSIFETAPEGIS